MNTSIRQSAFLLLFALATLSGPREAARAQTPPRDDGGYQDLLAEAVAAFDAGRFAEARSLFGRVHALEPTARTLRALGMCAFEMGDHAAAVAALEDALVDPRRPLSPEQREEVERLLASARALVVALPLELSPEGATLTVDGAPATLRDGTLLLDPGSHELRAIAEGYAPFSAGLVAESGRAEPLAIALEPAPAPRADAATDRAGAALPEAPAPSRHGARPLRIAGFAALGAGAALGGASLGLGLRAHRFYEDLEAACPCPGRETDIDEGERLARASTATSFAAAAAGAAGVTLLVLEVARGEDAPAAPARATLELAPGYVGGAAVIAF